MYGVIIFDQMLLSELEGCGGRDKINYALQVCLESTMATNGPAAPTHAIQTRTCVGELQQKTKSLPHV